MAEWDWSHPEKHETVLQSQPVLPVLYSSRTPLAAFPFRGIYMLYAEMEKCYPTSLVNSSSASSYSAKKFSGT